MRRVLRIIESGLKPARWNVAMTAALAELHATARISDTLRFHRYPACVLIGRSQDAGLAADLGYCRREGIEIARRVTGGGAVFMTPETLAWDVIVDRGATGSLEDITRQIGEGVAAGLSQLGVVARFRPPNDIEIDGRKVSGTSGYASGRSALLQGTVLVTDIACAMASALRLSETMLRGKITSLAEAGAALPSPPHLMACLTSALTAKLHYAPVFASPSTEEVALCENLLRDELGTDAFVRESTGAAVWLANC